MKKIEERRLEMKLTRDMVVQARDGLVEDKVFKPCMISYTFQLSAAREVDGETQQMLERKAREIREKAQAQRETIMVLFYKKLK